MASYYVWSGATGSGNGSSWANAFTTLTLAYATEVAGDTLYVAHDHAESSASAVTLSSSGTLLLPTKVVCVDRAGSVPPVSADRRATAQVSTTGATNITIGGTASAGITHYDGIIFNVGSGSTSSASLVLGNQASQCLRFDNCSFRLGVTGANGSSITAGSSGGTIIGQRIELNNTTMSFAANNNTGPSVQVSCDFVWRNTPAAILLFNPTVQLFGIVSARGGMIECSGVDLSALGSGKTLVNMGGQANRAKFVDCKLHASVTKAVVGNPGSEADFVRSGAGGVNYAVHCAKYFGTLTEETTIVRTGGASDGTTPIAWKIVTIAHANYSNSFECPPIAIWNDTVGAPVTATVEGVWGGGAVPNDDDIWLDVEYLGDASSPQGSFVHDGKADLLAAAAGQASSSASWGGSTTKFKLACTFTPQQAGWIYARVKCAKPSSTFYIDPMIVLS
jgi:hypothetical protein